MTITLPIIHETGETGEANEIRKLDFDIKVDDTVEITDTVKSKFIPEDDINIYDENYLAVMTYVEQGKRFYSKYGDDIKVRLISNEKININEDIYLYTALGISRKIEGGKYIWEYLTDEYKSVPAAQISPKSAPQVQAIECRNAVALMAILGLIYDDNFKYIYTLSLPNGDYLYIGLNEIIEKI